MGKKEKAFPGKQFLEKGLETVLKSAYSDRRDKKIGDQDLLSRTWQLKNLMIHYYSSPLNTEDNGIFEEFENVEVVPKLFGGKFLAYENHPKIVYSFDVDKNYMADSHNEGNEYVANGENHSAGFRYSTIFPDYTGLLDDEHTLKIKKVKSKDSKTGEKEIIKVGKRMVPKITRKQFLDELKKLVELCE